MTPIRAGLIRHVVFDFITMKLVCKKDIRFDTKNRNPGSKSVECKLELFTRTKIHTYSKSLKVMNSKISQAKFSQILLTIP